MIVDSKPLLSKENTSIALKFTESGCIRFRALQAGYKIYPGEIVLNFYIIKILLHRWPRERALIYSMLISSCTHNTEKKQAFFPDRNISIKRDSIDVGNC